jgi:hypothetical protein
MEWWKTARDGKQGDGCGNKDSENYSREGKAQNRVFLANPKKRSLKIP